MNATAERIAGDARVPSWAARADVAELLDAAAAGDVCFVQRRRDGVVLIALVPLEAHAPELRAVLERGHASVANGAMSGGVFRRWLLALDHDGSAAVVQALAAAAPRGDA
ncbi:MAG TPA: hypothetical protein VHS09_11050 [Polyangiaceae bacterium]|nr:hypothetical protein [Polyangiaceae bacterium]